MAASSAASCARLYTITNAALRLRQRQRARRRVQRRAMGAGRKGGREGERESVRERQCRLKSPAKFNLIPLPLPRLNLRRGYKKAPPRLTTQAKVFGSHERTAPWVSSRRSKPWALRSVQPRASSTPSILQKAAVNNSRCQVAQLA